MTLRKVALTFYPCHDCCDCWESHLWWSRIMFIPCHLKSMVVESSVKPPGLGTQGLLWQKIQEPLTQDNLALLGIMVIYWNWKQMTFVLCHLILKEQPCKSNWQSYDLERVSQCSALKPWDYCTLWPSFLETEFLWWMDNICPFLFYDLWKVHMCYNALNDLHSVSSDHVKPLSDMYASATL